MNCYYHPDTPAVGFCKSCCRGLCQECAAELPNGLACRSICEDRVHLINGIIDRNQQVLATANRQVRSSGILILALGVVFIVLGLVPLLLHGSDEFPFMAILGFVFTVFGILRLARRSQYYPIPGRN